MILKYFLILVVSSALYAQEVLGKIDMFDLPELGLKNIKAKMDSGAKTSSIRCLEIIPLKDNYVKFSLFNNENPLNAKYVIKPVSRVTNVKSSNGEMQKRYFIKTAIVIYEKSYNIELSLSFRENMIYPLLIGRELLKQGFVVDVSKKYLSYKAKSDKK